MTVENFLQKAGAYNQAMSQASAARQASSRANRALPGQLRQREAQNIGIGIQNRQRQQELQRVTEKNNLTSMVQGALEFRNITDEAQQDAYLTNRIAAIEARGGDAQDSKEMLAMNTADRKTTIDNVITMGERFRILTPGAKKVPEKFTKPFEATKDGKPVLVQQSQVSGKLSQVEGFGPAAKKGQVITIDKDGTVTLGNKKQEGLTRSTRGMLQKQMAINDASTEVLTRLKAMAEKNPKLLNRWKQWGANVNAARESFGGDLTEDQKVELQEYEDFASTNQEAYNFLLHKVSGGAVTPGEAKRARAAYVNGKLSYTQYLARLNSKLKAYGTYRKRAQLSLDKNRLQVPEQPEAPKPALSAVELFNKIKKDNPGITKEQMQAKLTSGGF